MSLCLKVLTRVTDIRPYGIWHEDDDNPRVIIDAVSDTEALEKFYKDSPEISKHDFFVRLLEEPKKGKED